MQLYETRWNQSKIKLEFDPDATRCNQMQPDATMWNQSQIELEW